LTSETIRDVFRVRAKVMEKPDSTGLIITYESKE